MYTILIQFLFFTYYIIYIWSRYGIQSSISDSWYTVDNGKKWMFTLIFCFVVGIAQIFHASLHTLFFFSGAFLCFTGAAAAFRDDKITKIVHYVGAFGAITFSVVALWFLGAKWVLPLNAAFILAASTMNNKLWWVEIFAFYTILGGLLQIYLS